MIIDHRLGTLATIRSAVTTTLLPFQHLVLIPGNAWVELNGWFTTQQELQRSNEKLQQQLISHSLQTTQVKQLQLENQRLRSLLDLQSRTSPKSLTAEVIYQFPSQLHHQRWLINRGSMHGITPGSPVLIESGLIGQITRSHPFSAELTLLQDKSIAIPVVNVRTQQRGIAMGDSSQRSDMVLAYTAANADIKVGDDFQTSGLDGIYPSGIPVARAIDINRRTADEFAQIRLKATAGSGLVKHVLILLAHPRATGDTSSNTLSE